MGEVSQKQYALRELLTNDAKSTKDHFANKVTPAKI